MMVLADKSEIGWTDAALLIEELTRFYSTPTPKGWHGAEKESNLYWLIVCHFYNSRGPIFIPGA